VTTQTGGGTGAAVTVGSTGDYCSLTEIKSRLWPEGTTPDSVNDTDLASVITACSRIIDNYCGRRFWATTADEVRYFTAQDCGYLSIDDAWSVSSVQTDEDGDRTYEYTWTTADYDLCPINAQLDTADPGPYTWMEITPLSNYSFPAGVTKGIKLTGKFGFTTATTPPKSVNEACILQCIRWWKRKDAPFAIMASPEYGTVAMRLGLDPDIKLMLDHYKRFV
jgi:hypothetical protein